MEDKISTYPNLIKEKGIRDAMLQIEKNIVDLISLEDKELDENGELIKINNFSPEIEEYIKHVFNKIIDTLWENIDFKEMKDSEIKNIETEARQINNFGFKAIFLSVSKFFPNKLINELISLIEIPQDVQDILTSKNVNIDNTTKLTKDIIKQQFFVNSTDFILEDKKIKNVINNQDYSYEDKIQYLLCIIRSLGTGGKFNKDEFYEIYEDLSQETNFEDIFKERVNTYIKNADGDITSFIGGFTKTFKYFLENNKFDILKKICNSIKNVEFGFMGPKQNLLNYIISQTISSEIKNKNFTNLQNIINIAYKDKKTKKEFLLNNFNEEFKGIYVTNVEERKKDLIKSYVELIYNVYPNIDERNEILMDFLSKIDKEYQPIVMTTVLENEEIEKNKSQDTIDSITITNIDKLKLKNKAYTFIAIEQNEVELKTHDYGKHIIIDVKNTTDKNEYEKTYSIEIPDMKNATLENIKIYHYSKSEEGKSGIRTQIKFKDVETENKFKEMIIDAICKGRGIEIEGSKSFEKLNMAIDAIKKGKLVVQNIDNPINLSGTFGESSITTSWVKKEKLRPKCDSFGLSKSGGN